MPPFTRGTPRESIGNILDARCAAPRPHAPSARNLEVLAVGEPSANADPSTTTVPVTVALDEPSSASQLALADEDGKINLLLESSHGSTTAIPQASQGSAP